MGEVGVGQPAKGKIGTEIVDCLSRFRNGSSLLVGTVVIVTYVLTIRALPPRQDPVPRSSRN
jgi:hypothetical protein